MISYDPLYLYKIWQIIATETSKKHEGEVKFYVAPDGLKKKETIFSPRAWAYISSRSAAYSFASRNDSGCFRRLTPAVEAAENNGRRLCEAADDGAPAKKLMRGVLCVKGNIEERACELAVYIIENRATVRAAAKQFGVSKSTVHKDLSERLPAYNRTLYQQVKAVLDQNKAERHIRGGIATRKKYKGE